MSNGLGQLPDALTSTTSISSPTTSSTITTTVNPWAGYIATFFNFGGTGEGLASQGSEALKNGGPEARFFAAVVRDGLQSMKGFPMAPPGLQAIQDAYGEALLEEYAAATALADQWSDANRDRLSAAFRAESVALLRWQLAVDRLR